VRGPSPPGRRPDHPASETNGRRSSGGPAATRQAPSSLCRDRP
jgi:hypothetical protein